MDGSINSTYVAAEFSSEHKYAEPLVFVFSKKKRKKTKKEHKMATSDRYKCQSSQGWLKNGTAQERPLNVLRRPNTQREQQRFVSTTAPFSPFFRIAW
jgi:hypothetical protein